MDEAAYAFDAHDKDPEDDGRVFQKEWVGQEAEYESPCSAGEQDKGDDDDNTTAAVLGEPVQKTFKGGFTTSSFVAFSTF